MKTLQPTTPDTLTRDLTRSLVTRGHCPPSPTLGQWLAAVYAHGVTLNDPIVSIEFTGRSGRLFVVREVQGGPVSIGESK